jgi:hypothetical protein
MTIGGEESSLGGVAVGAVAEVVHDRLPGSNLSISLASIVA